MSNPLSLEFAKLFRLRSTLVVCGIAIIFSTVVGAWEAVAGILIGYALFVLKSFFLYEAGRSLLGITSKRKGRAIAALSSLGRILFLAAVLALVSQMGTLPLLSACGVLLVGQVNLHLSYIRKRRIPRCSST